MADSGVTREKQGKDAPVIDLSQAPGEHAAWDRPLHIVYLWALFELVFVANSWQVSSRLRIVVLRLFGATIGRGVIFRPRTRVKFPWKLRIGDNAWIGEGAWIHNQDSVVIGDNVVVSQDAFITTGSHALRRDMALITRAVSIEDGAWVTTRCVVLGGVTIGRSSVVTPNSVVGPNVLVPPNTIVGGNPSKVLGRRFEETENH